MTLHSVAEHGRRLIADAWNEPGKASANVNKQMIMFISTFGASLPAAPWKRLRNICNDVLARSRVYLWMFHSMIL